MSSLFTNAALMTWAVVVFFLGLAAIMAYAFKHGAKSTVDAAKVAAGTIKDPIETGIKETGAVAKKIIDKGAEAIAPIADGTKEILKSVAERIGTSARELARLRNECERLTAAITHLESMKIETTAIRGILMAAFVEVESRMDDFMAERTTVQEPGRIKARVEDEYLGLLRLEFIQRLGLNLERLLFSEPDAEGRLTVTGLRDVMSIGVSRIRKTWLVKEIRRHTTERALYRADTAEILLDAGPDGQADAQEQACMAKLDHPNWEGSGMAQVVAAMALRFLAAFFVNSGHVLQEAKPGDTRCTLTLAEVVDHINRGIQSKTDRLLEEHHEACRQMDLAMEAIPAEIAKIAGVESSANRL